MTTLDINSQATDRVRGDRLASDIVNAYQEWTNLRRKWTEEKKELRNYLFATDTTKTSNSRLPYPIVTGN